MALAVPVPLVLAGGGKVVMIVPVLVTTGMLEESLLDKLISEVDASSPVAVLPTVEGLAVLLDEVALPEVGALFTFDDVLLSLADEVGDGLGEEEFSEFVVDEVDGTGVGVGSCVVELSLVVELEVDLAAT